MIAALATGQVVRAPKSGTSASGTRWANTTLRCSTGTDKEGAALSSFVSVIAFGDTADKLAKLGQGDAISVQGPMKQTQYTTDSGEVRHGLEILANNILTPYAVRQRRGDPETKAANSNHGLNIDRDQARAYGDFAKRATPALDVFADEKIPF